MKLMGETSGPADKLNTVDKIQRQRQHKTSHERLKSSHQAVYETMQAGLKPPQALFDTFMREADLIMSYKWYGEQHSKEFNLICSRFKEAFADNDIEQMMDMYNDLEIMKQRLQHVHHI